MEEKRKTHLMGGILSTHCGRGLDEVVYVTSTKGVTCKICIKKALDFQKTQKE